MRIFVTGTDTGVGKTFVCAHYMNQWASEHPFYYKPLQTGSPSMAHAEDILAINQLTHHAFDNDVRCGFCLKAPLSPYQAARAENLTLNPAQILADLQAQIDAHETLVVEGAGGLLVPITPDYFMLDLISQSGLPVVLVTRPQLGTVNHSLLSLRALQSRGVPILGFIMNQFPVIPTQAEAESLEMIEALSGVKCIEVILSNSLCGKINLSEVAP